MVAQSERPWKYTKLKTGMQDKQNSYCLKMQMQKGDVDFIETVRPNMKLYNNDGVKFKIVTTRNH